MWNTIVYIMIVSDINAMASCVGPSKKKDKLLTMDSSEITYEMVARKLREIVTSRGRKGTDKQEQVQKDENKRMSQPFSPSCAALMPCNGAICVTALAACMRHRRPPNSICATCSTCCTTG